MSFTPNFTTNQNVGNASTLVVTDTSTGSDVLIVGRRVSLQLYNQSYLVPSGNASPQYITWLLVNSSISIDVLNQDYSIYVTVDWLNNAGAAIYTKTTLIDTTLYSEEFAFGLCQQESSDPSILADNNYLMNAFRLRLNIDNANQAVAIGGNIFISQSQLNKAQYLIENASLFY